MRQFRFTSSKEILQIQEDIKRYVFESIEIEEAGLKIEFKKEPETFPKELIEKFKQDPILKSAFEKLTLEDNVVTYFILVKPNNPKPVRPV